MATTLAWRERERETTRERERERGVGHIFGANSWEGVGVHKYICQEMSLFSVLCEGKRASPKPGRNRRFWKDVVLRARLSTSAHFLQGIIEICAKENETCHFLLFFPRENERQQKTGFGTDPFS